MSVTTCSPFIHTHQHNRLFNEIHFHVTSLPCREGLLFFFTRFTKYNFFFNFYISTYLKE
ncbi:hypothetical protein HanRHA438_Chr08g0328201 [Helianthus annuus]|nr:hypothetical protein HanRHA438_Chr08g0328201 [Helianthus annuus]